MLGQIIRFGQIESKMDEKTRKQRDSSLFLMWKTFLKPLQE